MRETGEEEKLLKSRLQIANDTRDKNDQTYRIYCEKCIRFTNPDEIPITAALCAFCWSDHNEFHRYKEWFRQRFIVIAHSRDLKIHHKSKSQDVIRCITTMVREKNPPPAKDMVIQAMKESYCTGKYLADFRTWRKEMAKAISEIYSSPRKNIIKISQGRQTGQLKLGFFQGD